MYYIRDLSIVFSLPFSFCVCGLGYGLLANKMTSCKETLSALLVLCEGNQPVTEAFSYKDSYNLSNEISVNVLP